MQQCNSWHLGPIPIIHLCRDLCRPASAPLLKPINWSSFWWFEGVLLLYIITFVTSYMEFVVFMKYFTMSSSKCHLPAMKAKKWLVPRKPDWDVVPLQECPTSERVHPISRDLFGPSFLSTVAHCQTRKTFSFQKARMEKMARWEKYAQKTWCTLNHLKQTDKSRKLRQPKNQLAPLSS